MECAQPTHSDWPGANGPRSNVYAWSWAAAAPRGWGSCSNSGGSVWPNGYKGQALLPALPGEVAQAFAEVWRLALAQAEAAARAALTEEHNVLFAEQTSLTQERKLWEIALAEAQANLAEHTAQRAQAEAQLGERQALVDQCVRPRKPMYGPWRIAPISRLTRGARKSKRSSSDRNGNNASTTSASLSSPRSWKRYGRPYGRPSKRPPIRRDAWWPWKALSISGGAERHHPQSPSASSANRRPRPKPSLANGAQRTRNKKLLINEVTCCLRAFADSNLTSRRSTLIVLSNDT